MKRKRLCYLPPGLLAHLRYEARKGHFSFRGEAAKTYVCSRDGVLLVVDNFEILAHRVAFQCLDIDIGDFVVSHLDGDKSNNAISNLLLMTKGDSPKFHFAKRQLSSRYEGSRDYGRAWLLDFFEGDAELLSVVERSVLQE